MKKVSIIMIGWLVGFKISLSTCDAWYIWPTGNSLGKHTANMDMNQIQTPHLKVCSVML